MKRLWILLAVAAAARLSMHALAMPPYAGLDEGYHAGRLAFVAAEGRSPRIDELSMPPYVLRTLEGRGVNDAPLTENDLRPYGVPNYEAQHPSLYYALAAPLVHLLPERTQMGELRLWRLVSVALAVIVVLMTAFIGTRVAGAYGFLAAAALIAIPTWQTLLIRASNDALACAAIAVAFAISFTRPQTTRGVVVESLAWAFALAVKFYAWPASVAVFALWWVQRAPWKRRLAVMTAGGLAVLATVTEIMLRTRNPLGLMFDPTRTSIEPAPLRWLEIAKITIASFAWTSGHHFNALRPMAIALYLGPLLVVGALVLVRNARAHRDVLLVCAAGAFAFALAQLVNVFAYRRFVTDGLPGGGKEGWYWYALAPLWFGVLVALVLRYMPRIGAIAVVAWIVGWDVFITEGALLQDWLGMTSAAAGDAWFRWGPRRLPFTYDVPLFVTALRALHVATTAWIARDVR